jgi:LDH2 family malate/lactate/ureidoglycolate dehydrogenase
MVIRQDRFAHDVLTGYARDVLVSAGLSEPNADVIAGHLVQADSRGVHSHGTDLLPPYFRGFREGHLNVCAEPKAVHRAGSIAVVDGENGLGHLAAHHAMQIALEMAAESGLAAVSVRNSNHFGMAGAWPLMAIERHMIGFATTNGPSVMAPWGARVAGISNNPFSWGVPSRHEPPILLDMALTVSALGRIRLAAAAGEQLPQGWALGPDGRPTGDPVLALGGVLLPVGGYKGSGIAVVNEILSSALSGASFLGQIPALTMAASGLHMSWSAGHFFLVLDPAVFRPIDDFLDNVDEIVRTLKATPSISDGPGVTLPGERGFQCAADAERLGVALPRATVEKLTEFAKESGVPFIRTREGLAADV